mgnify:CR=1 FL=1
MSLCHSERCREWSGWEAETQMGRPKAERAGSQRIKISGYVLKGKARDVSASLDMTTIQ